MKNPEFRLGRLALTRLLLIRHAQSVANVEGRMQGSGDDPLTPLGEAQASRLAHRLANETAGEECEIFCSPLQRARQTTEVVAEILRKGYVPIPGLAEINLGTLEGTDAKTLGEVVHTDTFADYGAELPQAFAKRIKLLMFDTITACAGKTIIIITHLGVICNAMAYLLNTSAAQSWQNYGGYLQNTAITEFRIAEHVTLVRHNDASHT